MQYVEEEREREVERIQRKRDAHLSIPCKLGKYSIPNIDPPASEQSRSRERICGSPFY